MITLRPLERDEANARIVAWHRHHKPVQCHKFAVGAFVNSELVGVAIVGRPSAPALQDGITFELTRLATPANAVPHVASKLIAACWRSANAIGVTRMVSYTRADEKGTCYLAAGWKPVKNVRAEEWTHGNKLTRWLPGLYTPSTEVVDRIRWEVRSPDRPKGN